MLYLFNNINIYYNQYVLLNPIIEEKYVSCGKTYIRKTRLIRSDEFYVPSTSYMLDKYIDIRNIEEDSPFSANKIRHIKRKAKNLEKKLDIKKATSYISNEFKDQVWNKNYGYDDFLKRLNGDQSSQLSRTTSLGTTSTTPGSGNSSSTY
jgi:hypothetical protein